LLKENDDESHSFSVTPSSPARIVTYVKE